MEVVAKIFMFAKRKRRLVSLLLFCLCLIVGSYVSGFFASSGFIGTGPRITSAIGFSYIQTNNLGAIRSLSKDDAALTFDEFGRNLLMFACSVANSKAVRILLNKGSIVNRADVDGNTALLYAVRSGAEDIVALLLRNGANPNVKNSIGLTPLIMNSIYGNTAIANLLIKHGALIDVFDDNINTPLVVALVNDKPKIASLLLDKYHASPNFINSKGENALMVSITHSDDGMALKLIPLTKDLFSKDIDGRNALHMAILRNIAPVVDALLLACPELLDETYLGFYPTEIARNVSRQMLMIVSRYSKVRRAFPNIGGSKSLFMNKALNQGLV